MKIGKYTIRIEKNDRWYDLFFDIIIEWNIKSTTTH